MRSGYIASLTNSLCCLVFDTCVVYSGLAKELYLNSNTIGYKGAEKVAEALPKLLSLREPRLDSHVPVESVMLLGFFALQIEAEAESLMHVHAR